MSKNALIVLVQENPADERLRQTLEQEDSRFRVHLVDRVATALARIAGGGVDLVILDLSDSDKPESERLNSFHELLGKAPGTAVLVVDDVRNDGLVRLAAKAGSADYLTRTQCGTALCPMVRSLLGRRIAQPEPRPHLVPESRNVGSVSALMGIKGGVGTTTLALNVACTLAQRAKVILIELRPTFGTLSTYFHVRHLPATRAPLAAADAGRIGPAEIKARLWTSRSLHGLSILFGPQTGAQCLDVSASRAREILKASTMLADYVVVDLPTSVSETNHAVIEESDCLLVVVERDPLCIGCARPALETIRGWTPQPPLIGSVIVNRALLAAPMDLSEIEMQLAIPTLAVIPPAIDSCIAAQKAAVPLALFEPDSIAAQSMISLAETVAGRPHKPAKAS